MTSYSHDVSTSIKAGPKRCDENSFTSPVRLLMHGGEDRTCGGPSIRVPRSAEELRKIGVPATASTFHQASNISEDMVHLFNVWPPESALRSIRLLKAAGKRVVFSPIYLDFSEMPVWSRYSPEYDHAAMRQYLQGRGRQYEITPGYHAKIRQMLSLADHVIFLSQAEREALEAIGGTVPEERSSLIHNPVDTALWQREDPELFRTSYQEHLGHSDYVICIGRIEPRKNQLAIALALRGLPFRLVLVGHEADPVYAKRIRQAAGTQVLFTGRLRPGGKMLRSAISGSAAFILPSWSEGASLAALEAAATGAGLILSDRSSEREYFGDLARYCDPADPQSLRAALLETVSEKDPATRAASLQSHIANRFSWEDHARGTQKAYACAAKAPQIIQPPQHLPMQTDLGLAIDLTALTRSGDFPNHSLRYIKALVQTLLTQDPPPRLIFWSPERGGYLDLPRSFLNPADARRYAACAAKDHSIPPVCLTATSVLFLGDISNTDVRHLDALEYLKALSGGALIVLIEDVGPCLRPDLFSQDHVARFNLGFNRLVQIADHLICPTDAGTDALKQALEISHSRSSPVEISVLPLPPPPAAPPGMQAKPDAAILARFEGMKFALVPCPVSPRSNITLLTQIWAGFSATSATTDFHLVIAGGIAEGGTVIADRILRDPRLARQVHLLAAEEADLAWLYQNALVTLCPSESEGWGWPVMESLFHGTPCLVADVPVLAGPALGPIEAIDPFDFVTWKQRIEAYASTAAMGAVVKDRPQQASWSDIAKTVTSLIRQPRTTGLVRALLAGEIASAGLNGAPNTIRFGKGWHPAEEHLRWAAADSAEICLRTDAVLQPGSDHLLLHLRLQSDLPANTQARLRITSGETALYDAPVSSASMPENLVLSIPANLQDSFGCLWLTLHLPALACPSAALNDPTAIVCTPRGIGLVSATLLDAKLTNPLAVLPRPEFWSEGQRPIEVDFELESHRSALAAHLHFAPAWGIGSPGPHFTLFVPILPGTCAQTLELTLRPIATATSPSGAHIYWNGRLLAAPDWENSQPVHLSLSLTEEDLRSAPSVLKVTPQALATPADLGLGHENQIAGLGLLDFTLTPIKAW